MYEVDEHDEPVDIKTFEDMPSDQVALALSSLAGDGKNDELRELVDTYHASWKKNPVISACLIAEAEKQNKVNRPELQSILDRHGDITVNNLKRSLTFASAKQTYNALNSYSNSETLRDLRNSAVFKLYSKIKPSETQIYDINPKLHKKDSIQDLAAYLIKIPEAAPHFLQKRNVQEALAQNPELVAKMAAEGNPNLRATLAEKKMLPPEKPKSAPPQNKAETLAIIEKETQKESAQTVRARKTIIISAKQKAWPSAQPPASPSEAPSFSLPKEIPSPQELQSLFDKEKEAYEPLAFSKPFEDFKKALEQRVDRPFSEAVMKYVSKHYETKGFYKSTEYSDYLKQSLGKESPRETAKETSEVKTPKAPEIPIVKGPSR